MTDDERHDPASLTGSYALNALSAEERAAVEASLAESESLRHEVTELADTAVLLGGAAEPVTPPPALKASIMDKIAAMPQLPPLSNDDRPVADVAAPVTPAPESPAAGPVEAPVGPAERTARARWFTKPVVALTAAAAALALIVGGGVLVSNLAQPQSSNQAADELAAINAASDSQRAVSEISGGGTATLVWSGELQRAAMIVDGLPALPSDKVYELWYIDTDSVARPAGTFTVEGDGSTLRVLDGDMQAGDTVGVTVEPDGGSKTPTTDPIVAIASA